MEKNAIPLLSDIENYYSAKLAEHGATPNGVDWNNNASQEIRFNQLCKIIPDIDELFSINDLGCGYGALMNYLDINYKIRSYLGIDISTKMIDAAKGIHKSCPTARFITSSEPDRAADFGIASGIFNVRLGRSDEDWLDYLIATLDTLHRTSTRGFSFNCLTSYSDKERMQDYLYYADPCMVFDLCKRKYSRDVALLHDYRLYEFTILVRKYQ
jgi:SAM-dependent methyltransferase